VDSVLLEVEVEVAEEEEVAEEAKHRKPVWMAHYHLPEQINLHTLMMMEISRQLQVVVEEAEAVVVTEAEGAITIEEEAVVVTIEDAVVTIVVVVVDEDEGDTSTIPHTTNPGPDLARKAYRV